MRLDSSLLNAGETETLTLQPRTARQADPLIIHQLTRLLPFAMSGVIELKFRAIELTIEPFYG